MKPHDATLVVARYSEDLEWLSEVPLEFKVMVYNKGMLIESLSALERMDAYEERDNLGRESETYLHHILSHREDDSEWTVFCQGNPFDHSPDFLDLLHQRAEWQDVQALSCQYQPENDIPPAYLADRQTGECIGESRVRSETYSLHLWSATRYHDAGSFGHQREYAKIYDLEGGRNMAAHFLSLAGLPVLAESADQADCGTFAYGAIFAVRTRLLATLSDEVLRRLSELACDHPVHGYVMERLWLHLFGRPFLILEALQEGKLARGGQVIKSVHS